VKRTSCYHWANVSDARAIGAPTLLVDTISAARHEATCASCRAEGEVWRSLSRIAAAPPARSGVHLECLTPTSRRGRSQPDDEDAIEAILRATARPSAARSRVARRVWQSAGIFAAAAVAGAGLLVAREVRVRPAAVAVHEPSVRAQEADLETVESIGPEPSCRDFAPGIVACFNAGAQLATSRLGGPHQVLELRSGWVVVSLSPQAPGRSFGVATPAGTVTAVGTIFAVEIDADGRRVDVRVERGEVAVSRASSGELRLRADESTRLDEPAPVTPLNREQRERDLALLSVLKSADMAAKFSDEARPAPAAEPLTEDAGPQRVSVDDGVAAPSSHVSTSQRRSVRPGLAAGRALRMQGDFRGAAEVYRAIAAKTPGTPEGQAALVSLGDLLLSELGDPSGALAAFDAYLANRGGDLGRQAAYGRVRALRALGRDSEERAAARAFVARYRTGADSDALRRELGINPFRINP
jgi:hypothetical protein